MRVYMVTFVLGLVFAALLLAGPASVGYPAASMGLPLFIGVVCLVMAAFLAYMGSAGWISFFGGMSFHQLATAIALGVGLQEAAGLGPQSLLLAAYLFILFLIVRARPKPRDLLLPRCSGPYK